MTANRRAVIRNIAEVPWKEFPRHSPGALSKLLVAPDALGARHMDYRISCYAPNSNVVRHKHAVQEQIYHVIEGEGLFDYDDGSQVVRKHDVIFIPPGVEHAVQNTGLDNLVFLVITSPPTDIAP